MSNVVHLPNAKDMPVYSVNDMLAYEAISNLSMIVGMASTFANRAYAHRRHIEGTPYCRDELRQAAAKVDAIAKTLRDAMDAPGGAA